MLEGAIPMMEHTSGSTSEDGSAGSETGPGIPRQRGNGTRSESRTRRRHVPATVKREMWVRDESRCTYVDDTRQRCRETRYLSCITSLRLPAAVRVARRG